MDATGVARLKADEAEREWDEYWQTEGEGLELSCQHLKRTELRWLAENAEREGEPDRARVFREVLRATFGE